MAKRRNRWDKVNRWRDVTGIVHARTQTRIDVGRGPERVGWSVCRGANILDPENTFDESAEVTCLECLAGDSSETEKD